MISPLRATGIIATGTAVSLLVSVLTSKALALLVGPTGVGIYGLMQSVLGVAGIVFGLGLATALVRSTASALASTRLDQVASLRTTAWQLGLVMALVMTLLGFAARNWVAGTILNNEALAGAVPVLGLAAGLMLLWSIETGALNGHHEISVLTQATVASSLLGGVAIAVAVALSGVDGIAVGLLGAAGAGLAASTILAGRAIGSPPLLKASGALRAARELLALGIPYALSQLAGTGAQLVLPVLVLYLLNAEAVGYYRAAVTISVGYLAFALNALAQDYYPRVAAAPTEELRGLIERRTRLVLALGVPVILVMLAVAPVAVALLYSGAFEPAARILQWQLIGDLLKLPAWAMAFAILARGRARAFFGVELVGGATLAVAVVVGINMIGLEGVGIGYLAAYATYYAVVWVVARTVAPIVPGRLQIAVVVLAATLVLLDLLSRDAPVLRAALLIVGAVAVAAVAWPRLWRLHLRGEL